DPAREPHPHLPAHNFIYRATLEGPEAMEAERARILAEFRDSGARTLLLSEEGLCLPGRPQLQDFFRPWLGQFDITVVSYLRRQDRYAESLYSQYVRENHVLARKRIGDFINSKDIWARFDYPANLALWEGIGEVIAVNYEEMKGETLHAPLLEAAGLPADFAIAPASQSNVSPPAEAIEVIRQMNLRKIDHSGPQLLALMHDSAVPGAARGHLLGARLRSEFLERVAGFNRVLAENWNIRFDDIRPEEPEASLHPKIADTHLRALALATLRLEAQLKEAPPRQAPPQSRNAPLP
ncbi:MAG: hypothetical protein ACLFRU_06895, partial [Paracoccaceae bacterium]